MSKLCERLGKCLYKPSCFYEHRCLLPDLKPWSKPVVIERKQ